MSVFVYTHDWNCVCRSGSLYQYSSEGDSTAKSVYTISKCGGCTRVSGESKPFTISVSALINPMVY